jgi:hypothetical protein
LTLDSGSGTMAYAVECGGAGLVGPFPLDPGRVGLAQRARIVLLAMDGLGTNDIVRRTRVSKPTVIAWKRRYAAEGIGGL